jgi:hypothetical protein
MAHLVRIGTRRSKLAMTQSGMMQRAIGRALGVADADLAEAVPLVEIVTTGDRVQDRRLMEIGGKALFTKEIEEALACASPPCRRARTPATPSSARPSPHSPTCRWAGGWARPRCGVRPRRWRCGRT